MSQDDDIELITVHECCRILGGSRPLHPATFYRRIEAGLYPKPVKPGPNTSRWIRSEILAINKNLIRARDGE